MLVFLASVISSIITSTFCLWYYQHRLQRKLGTKSLLAGLQKEIDLMIAEINKTTERSIILIENQIQDAKEAVQKLSKVQSRINKTDIHNSLENNKSYSAKEAEPAGNQKSPVQEKADETSIPPPVPETHSTLEDKQLTPREKAVMLHRNGHNTRSIAAQLNMSLGEVKLMISLHNRRDQKPYRPSL